jgi:16S rRNA (adenine1518-N6/adenine1519-N6)-dimethyltransferase
LPRKLGQHFLVRESVLERLALAACGDHTPRVVEIGPGRGALTRCLLPRTDELHAVEIDPALIYYLNSKLAGPKLHLHHSDVLSTDLSQWGPAVITGNLPYYITSPILEKFIALDARFPRAVFLMQHEVAGRLLARPGSRAYGYLTVATRLVCDLRLIAEVPRAAFSPPPKVDSAAVEFIRKPEVPSALPQILAFVSRCFVQKRKTLRNNLRPIYGPIIDSLPEAPLRAEQLSIARFLSLYARLSEPRDPSQLHS